MKHSSKGRKRKVFKKGKTHISFTGKSVTSNAGMALVSRAFEAFHISELLKAVTKDLDQNKRHPTHKLLQQLIALRIIGGKVIQGTSLLADPALKGSFPRIRTAISTYLYLTVFETTFLNRFFIY